VLNNGKIHNIKLVVIGTTSEIFLDGVSVGTQAIGSTPSTAINFIGKGSGAGNYFEGQILSAKFTDAGTVVANYVFDSGSDLYQLPPGESLGAHLVTGDNSTFTDSLGDWINGDAAKGILSLDSGTLKLENIGAGVARATLAIPTVIGKSYIFNADVSALTASSVGIQISNSSSGSPSIGGSGLSGSVGDISLIVTATATTTYLVLYINTTTLGHTVNFDNVSTRQLPDSACLLTNFATTDWNRYTQQRNITHDAGIIGEAWVGDNLITNSGFDADTDWTKGAGWSIGGGEASITISASTNTIFQGSIVANTSIYLMKMKQIDISVNNFNFYVGSVLLAISTDLGDHVGVVAAGADGLAGISCNASGTTGSIDNVSVQKLLEVAP